jgi:nicotinate-nucleotide adenylyltransferase
MSDYRFAHTAGVVEVARRLAVLYCPEKTEMLSAAALLHDVTKELPEAEQRRIMAVNGVDLRPDEDASPKIFHGITAALLIPARYPEWASPELISAVRWHTTARAGMTLTEALLYLADYIEEGRRFDDCIALRDRFWSAAPENMTTPQKLSHLRTVLTLSLEFTLDSLKKEGAAVCRDTEEAYLWLKQENHPF